MCVCVCVCVCVCMCVCACVCVLCVLCVCCMYGMCVHVIQFEVIGMFAKICIVYPWDSGLVIPWPYGQLTITNTNYSY